MMRPIAALQITCASHGCNSSGRIEAATLEGRLSETLTLANVGLLAKRFICHKCRSKAYIIHDEKGRLLFDTGRLFLCQSPGCGAAIPLLRLEANPQAVFCIRCQTDMEDVPEGPQFPETPIDKKSCPSCLKKIGKSIPTVVYQNRSDGTFFLGCSRYPKCHWSYDP